MGESINIKQLIDAKLIQFGIEAETKEDLIRELSSRAQKAGYVLEGYAQDVIDRENKYPTALPLDELKVAVPHAMTQEHVIKPVIVAASLKTPVTFKEMGDGVKDVSVQYVFMLVAKGDKNHLAVLQRLILMLTDGTSIDRIRDAREAADVADLLEEKLG